MPLVLQELQDPRVPQALPAKTVRLRRSQSETFGNVTTGEPGTKASVTNVGTLNKAILDFVIPQGPTGATGVTDATGAKGATGVTGATGTTLSEYAGLYNATPQQITPSSSSSPVGITLDAAMPTDTMTASGSKLRITNTGTYRIAYCLNATSKQSGEVKPYVRINNAAVEHSAVNGMFSMGVGASQSGETAYPKDFQNSILANLNAGDTVDLAIEFPHASKYPSFVLNVAAKRASLHAIRIK